MSLSNKKPQLHLQRKRKVETVKASPSETTLEKESPVKFEKIQVGSITEYYAAPRYAQMNTGDDVYAKDPTGNEYFYLLADDTPMYATATKTVNGEQFKVEIPPVGADGKPIYIHKSNRIVYPMNWSTNRPDFPLNENLDEEYLTDDIVIEPHYPIDEDGKVHYARNHEGDEIPIVNLEGKCFYATVGDGMEVYPKKSNGDEYYLANDTFNHFPALDAAKIAYYAKQANGDEFYPTKLIE